MEPHDFAELVDIRTEPGGTYIHSRSEVFSEGEELGQTVLGNWLTHFNVGLHHLHTSGHAHTEDICTIIQRINPRQLIPVHAGHPDKFANLASETKTKVVPLRNAETFELKMASSFWG